VLGPLPGASSLSVAVVSVRGSRLTPAAGPRIFLGPTARQVGRLHSSRQQQVTARGSGVFDPSRSGPPLDGALRH
jgi:hypothetical protein